MSTAEASVGFFSRLRWGPGSVATVVLVAVAALALIWSGYSQRDAVLEALGWFLSFIDVIIVLVKGLERITPKTPPPEDIVGAEGVVVLKISPPRAGVVKVRGEMWSATADEEIKEGEKVIVTARQGLYLKVKKKT
ncbi:MAG: NfeD family protein [Acidilobus sp.]